MRALTANEVGISRTDAFALVLDQFAALRTYPSSPTGAGGYRVLAPRRDLRPRTAWRLTDVALRARSRLRFSGSLSVIFIGGLALAVLAGPANCPCNVSAFDSTTSLSRLGYVQTASLSTTRTPAQTNIDDAINAAPLASQAELLAPDSISTGTLGVADVKTETRSLRDVPALAADEIVPARAKRLPSEIVPLADSQPAEIKVASVSPAQADLLPVLPSLESAGPATVAAIEIASTAADADDEPRAAADAPRRETAAHNEAPRRHAARHRAVKRLYQQAADPRNPPEHKRYPKWAKQMFDSNWQSQAFSYTR